MTDDVKESWDKAALAWAEFVRDGNDISREYLNNPGMFKILGDISGKEVLDLGCGEGYNTRILASKGAKITGIDYSDNMIALAREEENKNPLGIDFIQSDAANLSMLEDESFDIVSCFMVYMDFEDIESVTKEVARVLKPGGFVAISMPHPCFDMHIENGEKVCGWIYERMDDPVDRGKSLYVKQTDYFKPGKTETIWDMKRINKPFVTPHFRRTLTDYVNTLGRHNLYVSDLLEPKPTQEGLDKHPEFEKLLRVPQSIIFKATKIS